MRLAPAGVAALALFIVLFSAGAASASPRKALVVGGDHENPPYEYLERGEPTGFNVELMRAAAAVAGLQVDIRLGPWNEARRDLEQGRIDALSGMYYSEERAKLIDFSVPHTMVRSALFVRKDSPIRSFADLRGKEVILQEGDLIHDLFKRTGLAGRIVAVTDPDQQLRLLASGKHDCALMVSRLQGEYLVDRLGLTGLRVIDADLPQHRYCFAVRKGNHELLYRLDEGLNILKVSGKYREIYERWFGVYERRDMWKHGRTLAFALAIVTALFGASLLGSWALRRQVRLRTAALEASREELRRAHAELERRVEERTTELRCAKEQLEISEAEKALTLNSMAEIVTFQDPEYRIQWGNRHAAALAGTTPEGLRGRRCFEAFHGRSEPCPGCSAALVRATGEPQSAELPRPGGRTLLHRAYPVKGEDGRLLGTAVFALDITERKRAEDALRESEEWLKLAIEATGAGTLHAVPSAPATASPRFREMFGIVDDDAVKDFEAFLRLVHADDRDRVREAVGRAVDPSGDGLYEAEYRCVRPDGTMRWISARGKVQFAEAEGARRAARCAIVTLDITDRKREEEARRESEEWLQLTVEATGAGILQTVPFGPAKLSARCREVLGIPDDLVVDFVGFTRLVHPEDREEFKAAHGRALDPRGDGRMVMDYRSVRADGSTGWMTVRAKVQFAEVDGARRGVRLAGVLMDITDRKREEQALRESEERFHTLADNIAQLAWMADAGGDVFWFNRRCLDYTGATPDALELGRFIHPDHVGRVAERMGRCLSTGEVFEATFPLLGRDRRHRWFLSRAVPVRDGAGEVVRWLGTATDVTEQREVEEALRESEARGRAILASLAEGVVLHDAEGRVTSANEAAEKLLGSSIEEMAGHTMFDGPPFMLRPDGSPLFPEEHPVTLALRTGEGQREAEVGMGRPDGGIVWLAAHAQPVHLPDGRVAGVVSSFFDITQRRQALLRSEEHLRSMADSVPDSIVRFDRGLRHVFANTAAAAAIGAPLDRLLGRTKSELGMSAEHVAFWDQYLLKVFRTGSPDRFEFGLDAPEGRRYESRLVPERDRGGSVESVLAITRDITERKQAEEKLLASREELRALVARLNSVREEEKARLSRELHDEMGQILTGLRIELEALEERLGDLGAGCATGDLLDRAVAASELVTRAIDAMHDLLASLRPVALDRLGLGAALRQECRKLEARAGIACELAAVEDLPSFGSEVDTALFRIAQEALTNIVRHARASRAGVTLERRSNRAMLRIADDGRGISPGRESAGLGMLGMRERAERLGGELVVCAAPSGGTVVEARIPIRDPGREVMS